LLHTCFDRYGIALRMCHALGMALCAAGKPRKLRCKADVLEARALGRLLAPSMLYRRLVHTIARCITRCSH
jgi:hypothetical protein